jgi:hypothetical protein
MRRRGFLSLVTISKSATTMTCSGPYIQQLGPLLRRILAFCLPPQHDGINEWLWRRPCDVPESCYKLVELGIYSRATDKLHAGLWLTTVCDALADLQFCLADEGVEEMVKRIFANSLQLVRILGVP